MNDDQNDDQFFFYLIAALWLVALGCAWIIFENFEPAVASGLIIGSIVSTLES